MRDFYEDAREAMHRRAIVDPGWMKFRRETVEHPYGTMKWLMAHPRFLLRGLKKARAELAFGVLCYNLKRVINILGVPALLQVLRPSQPERQLDVSAITAVPVGVKVRDFSHSLLRGDDSERLDCALPLPAFSD